MDECRAILLYWREAQGQFRLLLLVLLAAFVALAFAAMRARDAAKGERLASVEAERAKAAQRKAEEQLQAVTRKAITSVRRKHGRLRAYRLRVDKQQERIEAMTKGMHLREVALQGLTDELRSQDRKVIELGKALDEAVLELAEARRRLSVADSAMGPLEDYHEHVDL